MRFCKKTISWICVLCLLAGFLPMLTRAEDQEVLPTETTPEQTLPLGEPAPDETAAPVSDGTPSENEENMPPQEMAAENTNPGELPSEPPAEEENALPQEQIAEALDTLSLDSNGVVEQAAEFVEPQYSYLDVPLFFQTDYPETMYGSGSVATSGCSITCLAMVATYLTGHDYRPDELARYFGGTAENNIRRLEIGSETMQLPFTRSENFHRTMDALREGKVAIALMNSSSIFTDTQHFIVLAGLNEEGRIMVNDPMDTNYSKWSTKLGLVEGFTENEILRGYSGAWIYDKSAMPDEPFLYSEPEPVRGEPRYPDIQLTLEEKRLLARVVWVEARGESLEGQQAVAEVVLNRLASDRYPDTLRGVIYAENQFRSVPFLDEATPYQAQYEAIEAAIYGPYILPEDVVHFATSAVNEAVWGRIGGHVFCYIQ